MLGIALFCAEGRTHFTGGRNFPWLLWIWRVKSSTFFSHLQPLFLLSDPYFNKVTTVKCGLLSYSLPQPSTSWKIKGDSRLGGYLRSRITNRGQCVSTATSVLGCWDCWYLISPLHICPACSIMRLCVNIFGSMEREGLVSQHAPIAVNIFVCLTVCFYFWEFDLTLVISRADLW